MATWNRETHKMRKTQSVLMSQPGGVFNQQRTLNFFPYLNNLRGSRHPEVELFLITFIQDSSGRGIGPSQRPLTTRQETENHAPGGIGTHNLSKRLTRDPRLRPLGHWDRHFKDFKPINYYTKPEKIFKTLRIRYQMTQCCNVKYTSTPLPEKKRKIRGQEIEGDGSERLSQDSSVTTDT